MQTREYAGPFVDHNPDYTGVAWEAYGASVSHIDSDDATGYLSQSLLGDASLAHAMVVDDEAIPQGSTIRALIVRFRLGDDALATAGALAVAPYIRYTDGAPTFQERVSPAHAVLFNDFDVEFPLDPDGLPWSRGSIYRKRGKLLRFGLRSSVSDLPTARLKWAECRFHVDFALPIPIVVTDPASLIGDDSAVFNGRLNPQGANASYPLSYHFEYGLTTDYGSSTVPVAGVVGDIDLAVSTPITGLDVGVGYHFRLVAETDDDTFYGGDQYFSTDPAAIGRFRLDEFKRLPTGRFDPADRTRLTSFGFDRPSGFTEDCPFLEFP